MEADDVLFAKYNPRRSQRLVDGIKQQRVVFVLPLDDHNALNVNGLAATVLLEIIDLDTLISDGLSVTIDGLSLISDGLRMLRQNPFLVVGGIIEEINSLLRG